MKIPEKLQKFKHPTLVIIGDFDKATLYVADKKVLDEVKKLKAPPKPKLPKEGSVKGGGSRFFNPSADPDEGVSRQSLAKGIAQDIKSRASEIKFIDMVMPAEMIRRIKDELPKAFQSKILKTIEKDLNKEKLVDIIERLENTK